MHSSRSTESIRWLGLCWCSKNETALTMFEHCRGIWGDHGQTHIMKNMRCLFLHAVYLRMSNPSLFYHDIHWNRGYASSWVSSMNPPWLPSWRCALSHRRVYISSNETIIPICGWCTWKTNAVQFSSEQQQKSSIHEFSQSALHTLRVIWQGLSDTNEEWCWIAEFRTFVDASLELPPCPRSRNGIIWS